jgi:hypothetical protein
LTQQAQESWVNKYKLYLLFYSLLTQNIGHFTNPLMQFIVCDMQCFSVVGSWVRKQWQSFPLFYLNVYRYSFSNICTVNHFISFGHIKSMTLSHCWYQVKFSSAILPQIFGVHEQFVIMFEYCSRLSIL